MTDDLKPCPFCRHRALSATSNADLWWISCTFCDAEMSESSREKVSAAWNTRALDPALQSAERERDEALSRVGELEGDAEFWCRMMGEAIDALDGIAGRELADDDELDYRDEASIAADAVRAKYKARSALSPTRGGGDEGVSVAGPDAAEIAAATGAGAAMISPGGQRLRKPLP